MAKSTPSPARIRNKKARLRYQVLEELECGLVLLGTEAKSLRQGRASLDEAFARITNGEIWLHGFHIPPYEHGNVHNHDPLRPRKILAHRREIARLLPKVRQRGLTLIPLSVYFSARGLAKVQIALVQGKTHRDKRQDLQKREHKREMDRAVRRGR